jgi:hypothetical protein
MTARGAFGIPTAGTTDDPSVSGATLLLTNPVSGESFSFSLPGRPGP